MSRCASVDLLSSAGRIVKRLAFHGCKQLVFIRPDGRLDSCPEFTERAAALLRDGAAEASGYKVVGVYAPGASTELIAADARECLG